MSEFAINQEIETDENLMRDRYLVFIVQGHRCALAIQYIIEIAEVLPITGVPFMPDYIKGIVNLRGAVVPVIDLGLRFGFAEQEYTEKTCIIVLEIEGASIGLVVSEVCEVQTIPADQVVSPNSLQNNLDMRFVKGIGNPSAEVALILKCEEIFGTGEYM